MREKSQRETGITVQTLQPSWMLQEEILTGRTLNINFIDINWWLKLCPSLKADIKLKNDYFNTAITATTEEIMEPTKQEENRLISQYMKE